MRRALRFLLPLLAVCFAVQPAAAKVTIGEHVARDLQTPHPYPSSGSDEPELSWSQEVSYPGATYVAVHFDRFHLADGDFVIVRSPDGEQSWTYEGLGKRGLGETPGGYFAAHIRGDTAIVELFTTGYDTAFGYRIDKFGRGYNETEIEEFWARGLGEKMNLPYPSSLHESLCTADDTEEAKCYQVSEPMAYDKSRAVARLLLNGSAWCTGWLVGCEGHVMTNEHCVGSQSQANDIDFEFMAEGATCETDCSSSLACPGVIEASGGTLVAVDAPLDYAMILADTSTANDTDLPATYGFLQLRESGAVLDEQIYVTQHPAGWGKRLAFESSYPEDVGLGGNTYATSLDEVACSGGPGDVGYWADTQGGSSGSPVIAYSDHRVVALHHCRGSAFCTSGDPGTDDRNRGVPIEAVIASLGADLPNCAVCDPPPAPTDLAVTATAADTVDLDWLDAEGVATTTYNVYRSEGACPGGTFTLLADGVTGTSYTDATATSDTLWSYHVTAFDPDTGCESDPTPCAQAPSFTVDAGPDTVAVCAPADGGFTVDVAQVGTFADPVSLSVSGVPAGAGSGFSPDPVTPPGSSTLTISSTGAATPGSYPLEVTGTGGTPAFTRSAGVELSISDAAPGAPALTVPADGAVDVALRPEHQWSAAAQADGYTVEWSTDPGFGTFDTAVVTGTSHTPAAPLQPDTEYFWRVRATNACGTGADSAVFSFTTVDLDLLLVDDDDNNPDVRSFYTDALDALGVAYDVWDTGDSDVDEPGAAELLPYRKVVWFSGDSFGSAGNGPAGPGDAAEAALGDWLDTGNCFFISSQDYHYDNTQTAFMTDYLGVASVDDDTSQTVVNGAGAIFGGTGPFTLVYPFTNFSDTVNAGAGAEVAFTGDVGNAAVSKLDGTTGYLTTFWGFPWEALPTAGDREATMQRFLLACEVGTQDPIFLDGFESGDTTAWSATVP